MYHAVGACDEKTYERFAFARLFGFKDGLRERPGPRVHWLPFRHRIGNWLSIHRRPAVPTEPCRLARAIVEA